MNDGATVNAGARIDALGAVLVLGLAAAGSAGCGDDDSTGAGTTTTTTTTTDAGGGGAGAAGGGGGSGGSTGVGGSGGLGGSGGVGGSGGSGGLGGSGGSGGAAPSGCTTTAPGSTRGSPIALSPDDARAVVANRDSGTVTVLDIDWADGLPAFTKKAEIAVGAEPWQVAIDGCGTTAYVVLRKDQKVVQLVDLDTVPAKGVEAGVGSEPTGLALTPNNGKLYVANWVDGTVSVVDTLTMTVASTVDLNPVLAGTGLLGATVSAAKSRPALAHPRSLAITNDGDADDGDETVLVTEFFGQRTDPEDVTAGNVNVDVNWEGLVYRISATDGSTDLATLSSIAHTSFLDQNGVDTGCFPNQLQSITVEGDKAYVTAICASPRGPTGVQQKKACTADAQCTDAGSTCDLTVGACTLQCVVDADCAAGAPAGTCTANGACKTVPNNFRTVTHPSLHVFDVASGVELDARVLDADFAAIQSLSTNGLGRIPLVSNDIAFAPGGAEAYVTANGVDAVFRLGIDGTGAVTSFGAAAGPFIGLDETGLSAAEQGQNPIGIAAANTHAFAVVAADVSRNVLGIDLDPTKQEVAGLSSLDPRVVASTDPPSDPGDQARLRGKRALSSGLDRWSFRGQGWGACQVCHFEGLSDNVTWYFGRGPRQSTSFDGSFASGDAGDQRIFNWTAVFDEVADFENVARGIDGGVGALVHTLSMPPVNADRINLAGNVGLAGSAKEISDSAASLSKSWDDVAAYIQAVRSPRAPTNLDAGAVAAGATLFSDFVAGAGCAGCHGGAKWTLSRRFYTPSAAVGTALLSKAWDGTALVASGFPAALLPATVGNQFMRQTNPPTNSADQMVCVLRPVGTFGVSPAGVGVKEVKADMASPAQGNDVDKGNGFNVPSMLGMQVGAPYFHAGNARTLEEALDALFAAHATALNSALVLSPADVDALVAYVLSVDEGTPQVALPAAPGAQGGDFCAPP